MKPYVIISVVTIAAAVAMLSIIAGQGQAISGFSAESPTDAPAQINYSKEQLRRHPRDPLPLTSPGSWLEVADYPSTALHSDLEGRVAFHVTVDVYGEVSDCVVAESSGVPAFDRRVCNAVATRARFFPALDERQEPVRGEYRSSVVWQIDRGDGAYVTVRMKVDHQGHVSDCRWNGDLRLAGDPLPVCIGGWADQQHSQIRPVDGFVDLTVSFETAFHYMQEPRTGR